METVRERELQHRQPWCPLDTMACSLDISTSSSSSSLFGWDPQLFYFGHGAVGNAAIDSGAHDHERHELELLFPKCMESLVSSEMSTAVTNLPMVQDAASMRRELDELLQNLWGSEEEGLSSCDARKEESDVASQHDHHCDLGTLSPAVPTSPEKTLMTPPQAEAELPSLSSSQGSRDPRASDASGAHRQIFGASKRSAPEEEKESRNGHESCKRSRTAFSTVGVGGPVLRPFAVVKPGGTDGEVTLADINEWILTPPARPVRHPVGEFACSPRVSAGNRPAPSGKTVTGFTRLRTAGRGTITVVRTRG